MSPHEQGDISLESERVATSGSHLIVRARKPDVCQSRGAARSIAAAGQTSQIALSARQRSGSGSRQPRPGQPRHHSPPAALARRTWCAAVRTMRFSLAARVVSFSGFRPESLFCSASIGDSSSRPLPRHPPPTWGRLDPDFSASAPA